MPSRQSILSDELSGDPLGRSYAGMTDEQAADDLNTAYRDAETAPGALFDYLSSEKARDIAGDTPTVIYGRLARVSMSGVIGQKTFGEAAQNSVLTDEGLDACRALLAIAEQDRLGSLAQVMTENKFQDLLNAVKDAGVMKPGDVTAIVGLSQNRRTRANEIGLGRVLVGHVASARLAIAERAG